MATDTNQTINEGLHAAQGAGEQIGAQMRAAGEQMRASGERMASSSADGPLSPSLRLADEWERSVGM